MGGGGGGGGRRRCGEGVETAIKSWCSARPTIALSSGEADVNALTKATIEGLGVQAEAKDIGWSLCVVVLVDSPTAESTASRSGVWKVRHLESNTLWIQGAARERKIGVRKVTSGPIHRLRAHHAAGFKRRASEAVAFAGQTLLMRTGELPFRCFPFGRAGRPNADRVRAVRGVGVTRHSCL